MKVNALRVTNDGRVWAGTEQSGVAMFDGKAWHTYTTKEGLPSNQIFGLAIDPEGNVWAATWEGIAKFQGESWSVPYTVDNNTISNNHTHAIAFDNSDNIGVGLIRNGVNQFQNIDGQWVTYHKEPNGIGGDQIRSIVVRKADGNLPESIWFATADGGISKFEQGKWTVYQVDDGLPSTNVRTVVVDKYNRIWAATAKGVAYLENSKWVLYDTIDTNSIAFGINCQDCPFDDEHIWTGTTALGLTHSRLPHLDNNNVVQIHQVCFEFVKTKEHTCQLIQEVKDSLVVTATYPKPLAPGEQFRVEIVVVPHVPYQLHEDYGDFLGNTDESNDNLFGAWEHIAVKGTIDSGQPFTFTSAVPL